MVDRPEPTCLPIEMELLPLYRDPPGSGRLRRQLRREHRQQRREARQTPRRSDRVVALLRSGGRAVLHPHVSRRTGNRP